MTQPVSVAHHELHELRAQLTDILVAIDAYQHPIAAPPILDGVPPSGGGVDGPQHVESVSGLRALKDAVRRDLAVLSKFLEDPASARRPPLSTNAPYLVAVWHEVRAAPSPVVGIWKTFASALPDGTKKSIRGAGAPPGVKVDVVAEGGARWVRVNTTKNSRMLAELRELDSYCTDSEDDSDDEEGTTQPTLAPTSFDNSLLIGARALLAAARAHPYPPTGTPPAITLRLTRLDPDPDDPLEHDPRIARTIDELHALGIDVQLGETPASAPAAAPASTLPRTLVPSLNVNLDLSLLVALLSDLAHSPPPASPADAVARFVHSPAYQTWKAARVAAGKAPAPAPGTAQHARALAEQALQDGQRGLLQEMRYRLEGAISGSEEGWGAVRFWTTGEARDRCLRIVGKIGGPGERRRARALFLSEEGDPEEDPEEAYWRGSRYPRGFLPSVPIHIFPEDGPLETLPALETPPAYATAGSFFDLLRRTCDDVLADAPVPDPRTLRTSTSARAHDMGIDAYAPHEDAGGADAHPEHAGDADDGGEIVRAAVTRTNARLTAHTVQSMRVGAMHGWTTLTANRSSVRAMLRELRGRHGTEAVAGVSAPRTMSVGAAGEYEGREVAALWIVEPRSLAEGMRADCEG